MSTAPAPFPPPPNSATYPISSLYLYPVFSTSTSFDPTKPYKAWQMPADPTKDPTEYFILWYYDPTGAYKSFALTYGEAMAPPNIAPSGLSTMLATALQSQPYDQQARPVPARALLPTESISNIALIGLQVSNSAYVLPAQPETPAELSTDAAVQQILANTAAIIALLQAKE